MKKLHQILLLALVAAAAVIAGFVLRKSDSSLIHLPAAVQTLAEGYDAVGPLKNELPGETQLATAVVELEPDGSKFPVSRMTLGFVVRNRASQDTRLITIENDTHTAYVVANAHEP